MATVGWGRPEFPGGLGSKQINCRVANSGELPSAVTQGALGRDSADAPHRPKFLRRKQLERSGPALRFYQWYAVADENRNDMDAELVDLSFVQKRSDDLATSHHPNILTALCAQSLYEWLDRLSHQLKSLQQ